MHQSIIAKRETASLKRYWSDRITNITLSNLFYTIKNAFICL